MEHLVLLIDDDEDEALLLELALHHCESSTRVYQVTELGQAMQFIDAGSERPSIIFLDMRMPPHTSGEVLHWIRTHPRINDVPVVIWSHTDNQTEINNSFQQGASFFLPKTADKESVQQALTDICQRWLP